MVLDQLDAFEASQESSQGRDFNIASKRLQKVEYEWNDV